MIYKSILDLIGNTPMVELTNIEEKFSLGSKIFAKLEELNPAGSVKDRVAKNMLDVAEKEGLIKKGDTIIEPTSGNTGIGLCMLGAVRGYKVIIVMPENMSRERIKTMEAYGASVVLTPRELGMKGAIEKANLLAKQTGGFVPSQFENQANPEAHYLTTGPEIYESTEGRVDIFVCGIGTGGTISGVGKYLKEKNPSIKIVGVEPFSSAFLTKGETGAHKIQGIGAGFKSSTLDIDVCDEIIAIKDEDAIEYSSLLAKCEGIHVGISAGAALYCSVELAKKETGKNIVVLLPDTGLRYLS
ncbi:MAG: cysteine synthase A [Clostridia bacterium]|nr:cysteine synthase A [Clostridia bacterium]